MPGKGQVRILRFLKFITDIREICLFYCLFPYLSMIIYDLLQIQAENQIPRQHPFSSISNISNIVDFFNKLKKILISLKFIKKITNFAKNCEKISIFLNVNFSLCAKFNRFFIILGGSPEKDRDFKNRENPRKIVIFGGFSKNLWFFKYFTYLATMPGKGQVLIMRS